MRYIFSLILTVSFIFSTCPDEFYKDDCGNCWMPYCYDATSFQIQYDIEESQCLDQNKKWVIPGINSDLYFNNYCDGHCPENFMADDCGRCWSGFCYSFFQKGLDDDPAHSVYYDLNLEECESYGYNYYLPNNRFNPYWNSSCLKASEDTKKENVIKISISVIIRLLALATVYLLVENVL